MEVIFRCLKLDIIAWSLLSNYSSEYTSSTSIFSTCLFCSYIYIKSLADYFLEGVGVRMHLDCLVRGAVLLFIITSPPFVLGAYKNHMFVLRLDLGPHDEIPEAFEEWATASFTMPATTVSKTQVRSISVENPNPPEKWVRYVAKYEYKVQMECRVETTSDLEGGSDWMLCEISYQAAGDSSPWCWFSSLP